MTTFIPFAPTPAAPFSFTLTLDGSQYTAVITWNLFRGGNQLGWYFNLFDVNGTRILTMALAGSPSGSDLNLVAGYFITSTVVFRESTQNFEIGP